MDAWLGSAAKIQKLGKNLVSLWGRLSLLLLPITSFVVGINTNLPTVFLFFPYKLVIFLSFILTFPSMSMFWERTKWPYTEFPFLLWCLFQSFPKAFMLPYLSELSLLTVVAHPVISVCSHLAYSAVSKEHLNFAGGFLSSSLFGYVLLTLKSVLS